MEIYTSAYSSLVVSNVIFWPSVFSNDAVKSAEAWQKLVELRRERGTRLQVLITLIHIWHALNWFLQLFNALSLILPQSSFYPVFATLPYPDPTNPTSTTTYIAQTAIHDSLPVLEQLIALLEAHEDQYLKTEVEKRRTRLHAPRPEQLQKEVGLEIWGTSQVRHRFHGLSGS